jgi:hypothetical protein
MRRVHGRQSPGTSMYSGTTFQPTGGHALNVNVETFMKCRLEKNTYPTRKIFDKLRTSNDVELRDMSTLELGVHGVALHVGNTALVSDQGVNPTPDLTCKMFSLPPIYLVQTQRITHVKHHSGVIGNGVRRETLWKRNKGIAIVVRVDLTIQSGKGKLGEWRRRI